MNTNEQHLCDCGCGKVTPIAPEHRPKRGWIKGLPMPFYPHHAKNRWPVSDGITKKCRVCAETKQVAEFHKNRRKSADGRQTACKDCSKVTTYRYRNSANGHIRTVTARFKGALKRYSLTEADYNGMLTAQNYVCAICKQPEKSLFKGAPKRLAVDHCHVTGKVRGLLCTHCNQAIGRLNDDPALIRKAADYVEKQQ